MAQEIPSPGKVSITAPKNNRGAPRTRITTSETTTTMVIPREPELLSTTYIRPQNGGGNANTGGAAPRAKPYNNGPRNSLPARNVTISLTKC